jgi:spore coat protein CotH
MTNDYYPANFEWRGMLVENVGVRSRCRGSRSPVKPNLKIDFDRYEPNQKFLGLKSTTLKANNQDASMVRERVTMKLFVQMGIPAPLETYARVFVNGQYFGLYNLIETIDKDFLRRTLGEEDGYLYEWQPRYDGAGYYFESLGNDAASYAPVHFDPLTHEKNPDPQPLVDMVRAINESPDAGFETEVSRYVDLRQSVTHLAVESYMAEFDGIRGDTFGMNNFSVYRRVGTTSHLFLPWDKDGTFSHPARDVMQGVERNVLARRALALPHLRQLYLDSLLKAASLMGASGGVMEQTINRLYDQMAVDARRDPFKQCSAAGVQHACGAAEFEKDIDYVRLFAQTHSGYVNQQFYALGAGGIR